MELLHCIIILTLFQTPRQYLNACLSFQADFMAHKYEMGEYYETHA